jgi:hypothetical protein
MIPFGTALGLGAAIGGVFGLRNAAMAAGLIRRGNTTTAAVNLLRTAGRGARAGGARVGGMAKAGLRGPVSGYVPSRNPLYSKNWVKAYPGMLGGLAKFGLGMGVAAGMEGLADAVPDMSPVSRAALHMSAFGARFGAYRNLIRGSTGSAFAAAQALTGRNFIRQGHIVTNTLMGGMFTRGSLLQRGMFGAARGTAGFMAKMPFRVGEGVIQAGVAIPRAMGSLMGMNDRSLSSTLNPRGALRGTAFGRWLYNKELDAPMGHGMFALFGGAAFGASYLAGKANQRSAYQGTFMRTDTLGYPNDRSPLDPSNFGAGMTGYRNNNNYGPALTLQLHRQSTRVMP